MANYVLVHGGNVSAKTWNQLVKKTEYPPQNKLGGEVWERIKQPLESKGHSVYAPTLLDEYTHGLSDHIEQVCTLIQAHQLNKVILVGHSYGGMIITGVAKKIPQAIDQLVYVDAAVPNDGQSLFDLLQRGGIDTQAIIEGAPKAYTEKLTLTSTNQHPNSSEQPSKKHYIRCLDSEFVCVTQLAKEQISAHKAEWTLQEIKTGHLPMATAADWLVDFLLGLAKQRG